jgi:hypothetical protein
MSESAKIPSVPPRRKRRAWKVVAGLLLLLLAVIALIPTALNTAGGQRWLLAKANATLAPGKLEVDRFRFSWFGPTKMDHFVIRDPQGDAVVDAKTADWDRSFFQILFSRPKYGTLTLRDAALDVERRADGSIDVVDALQAVLKGEPSTDFTIVVEGSVRLRDPGLAKPIEANEFNLKIRRPAAPGNVTWDAQLADRQNGRTLGIVGYFERWEQRADDRKGLLVKLRADRWPLHLVSGDVTIDTTVDGDGYICRADGRWHSQANLVMADLSLAGKRLLGDRLDMDSAEAGWSVEQLDAGWALRNVRLKSKVAEFSTSGPLPISDSDQAGKITGRVDLAALVLMLPRTLRLRDDLKIEQGLATLDITCAIEGAGRVWTAEAGVPSLAGRVGDTAVSLREPIAVSGRWRESGGLSGLESLAIKSAFLKASGRGDLASGIIIDGSLDLAALARQAGDYVDLGSLELAGVGALHAELRDKGDGLQIKGSTSFPAASFGPSGDALELTGLNINGSYRRGRTATADRSGWDVGVSLDSAKRAGLELGAARLAVRGDGKNSFSIDPIQTTLNGGKLRLVPELEFDPKPMLRLGPGTELVDAEVNGEASRRVLTFIAPVLDGGTKVTGRVSAKIDRAEFPLGKGVKTETVVEGNVVFQDLEFTPGPIASDLLGLIGRSDATLKLDQPVVLSIADGRVRQSGLVIPVGKVAKIEIAGDVGFDRSLDLRAAIPIMPELFPNGGVVGEIVAGSRITIPITGTLSRPKIDRDAFRAELARTGKGMMVRGAADLLFRLARPRDPNAPPPLTPAERKAKRLERRMEKRGAG